MKGITSHNIYSIIQPHPHFYFICIHRNCPYAPSRNIVPLKGAPIFANSPSGGKTSLSIWRSAFSLLKWIVPTSAKICPGWAEVPLPSTPVTEMCIYTECEEREICDLYGQKPGKWLEMQLGLHLGYDVQCSLMNMCTSWVSYCSAPLICHSRVSSE